MGNKHDKQIDEIIPNLQSIQTIEKNYNIPPSFRGSLLKLKDGKIAAFDNKRVMIFEPNNRFKCAMRIQIEEGDILSISQFEDGNLIIGTRDSMIKIYSIADNTYKCLKTIKNQRCNFIYSVVPISNDKFATCSLHASIQFWEKDKNYSTYDFKPVKELQLNRLIYSLWKVKNKPLLVAENSVLGIEIWNENTYQCETIFSKIGSSGRGNNFHQIDDKRIIIGAFSSLSILNIDNFTIEKTIYNSSFGRISSFAKIKRDIMLCGCEKGQLIIFNILTKKFKMFNTKLSENINDLLSINDNSFLLYEKGIEVWKC